VSPWSPQAIPFSRLKRNLLVGYQGLVLGDHVSDEGRPIALGVGEDEIAYALDCKMVISIEKEITHCG
jgi:hypothetical protein